MGEVVRWMEESIVLRGGCWASTRFSVGVGAAATRPARATRAFKNFILKVGGKECRKERVNEGLNECGILQKLNRIQVRWGLKTC